MFKLSSDVLANFRGVQSALQGLLDKIADIYRRLRSVEERIDGIPPGSSITLPIDAKCFVDTNSIITLTTFSNNCKTIEKTSGADNTVQCLSYQVFGDGLGKYYFEVELDVVVEPAKLLGVGVCNLQNIPSNGYVGQTANSWGYWANGSKYTSATQTTGYTTAASGNIVGVAVDTSAGKVWFAVNNTWIEGDPAAGTSASYTDDRMKGLLRAHFTPYVTNSKATLNGLSSELNYTPPTGFTAAFG